MNKLFIAGITLAIVGGGFFLAVKGFLANIFQRNAVSKVVVVESEIPANPWIEVVRPNVYKVLSAKDSGQELKTGDELKAGDTVLIDKRGLASVYFPDGSVLRLDSDTKFSIEETSFDSGSEKTILKAKLLSGKIWAKVLAIVTPDSLWEVRSSNAVATVRGTAFGFEFVGGHSFIFGSENIVAVKAINPKTGEEIKNTETKLEEKKIIDISDKVIEELVQRPSELKVRSASAKDLSQEWVSNNRAEDVQYEKKLDNLRREFNLEGKGLRDTLRETIYGEFKDEIKARKSEKQSSGPVKKEITEPAPPLSPPSGESSGVEQKRNASNQGKNVRPVAIPQTLEIETSSLLDSIIEGGTIIFKALLVMSDGSRQDVTRDAKWRVLGEIGSINSSGEFRAKLGDSVSELGEAIGSVVVSWKDKTSGKEFLGKTQLIKVLPKVDELIEPRG